MLCEGPYAHSIRFCGWEPGLGHTREIRNKRGMPIIVQSCTTLIDQNYYEESPKGTIGEKNSIRDTRNPFHFDSGG